MDSIMSNKCLSQYQISSFTIPLKVPLLYLLMYFHETGWDLMCMRLLILLSDMTAVAQLWEGLTSSMIS